MLDKSKWPEIMHYMSIIHDEPKPLPGSKFELQGTGIKDYQYTKIGLIKFKHPDNKKVHYYVAFMPTAFLHENALKLLEQPDWVLDMQQKPLYIEEILDKPDDTYTVDKFLQIPDSNIWMSAFEKLKQENVIQNAARVYVSKQYLPQGQ